MKHRFIIVLAVLALGAIGAPTATAQKSPCTNKTVRLLSAPVADDRLGQQLWIQESCGKRARFPFG
jgi:hypothetical protein